MGIQIEFNPELALRNISEHKKGNKQSEECIPEKMEAGKVYNFLKDALNLLKSRGFRIALIAGGGKLNASFMEENLVDEIYLDIGPILLGKGISLFAESDFESGLKLIAVKKLSKNEIQLHYKVLK